MDYNDISPFPWVRVPRTHGRTLTENLLKVGVDHARVGNYDAADGAADALAVFLNSMMPDKIGARKFVRKMAKVPRKIKKPGKGAPETDQVKNRRTVRESDNILTIAMLKVAVQYARSGNDAAAMGAADVTAMWLNSFTPDYKAAREYVRELAARPRTIRIKRSGKGRRR